MGSCLSTFTRASPSSTATTPHTRPPPPREQPDHDHDPEPVVKEVLSETPKLHVPTTTAAATIPLHHQDLAKLKRHHPPNPTPISSPSPLKPPDDTTTSEISDSSTTTTTTDLKTLHSADAESHLRPRLRPRHRSLSADLPSKRQHWRPAGRSSPSPVRRRPTPPPRRSISPSLKRRLPPPLHPPPPAPAANAEANDDEDSLDNPLVSLECFIFL